MPRATDLTLSSIEPQSMLFKGGFGFGKTLAALTFALEGPVYLSYWDKKKPIEMLTFFTKKRFGDLADKILANITYDVYSSANAGEYLEWLLEQKKGCPYFAIINDSFTYMTASTVNWSLNFESKSSRRNVDDVTPDWDEYKVLTSFVTQCIDESRNLPCHVIWTAHPLPTTKIEGSGTSIRVTKQNSIVAYGSKVAGMVPGAFTEIYHFIQKADWNPQSGASAKKFICSTEAIGDEFAKSPLLGDYTKEIDFTNKLFYQEWKDAITKSVEALNQQKSTTPAFNPNQPIKW